MGAAVQLGLDNDVKPAVEYDREILRGSSRLCNRHGCGVFVIQHTHASMPKATPLHVQASRPAG